MEGANPKTTRLMGDLLQEHFFLSEYLRYFLRLFRRYIYIYDGILPASLNISDKKHWFNDHPDFPYGLS